MKVDANIANAIESYLTDKKITAKEFAECCGVSEATMVKWKRQGNGIIERRWQILFKYIKKYLPAERIYIDQKGTEQYSSLNEGGNGSSYFQPKYVPQMVPKFTTEQVRQYNAMLQSVEQYAYANHIERVEYRPKVPGCPGIFCYQLPEASAGVPAGAWLFISSEAKPKPGCMVLAVLADNSVILGKYACTGNNFTIVGDRHVSGDLGEARSLFKLLSPVIMYEVVTY